MRVAALIFSFPSFLRACFHQRVQHDAQGVFAQRFGQRHHLFHRQVARIYPRLRDLVAQSSRIVDPTWPSARGCRSTMARNVRRGEGDLMAGPGAPRGPNRSQQRPAPATQRPGMAPGPSVRGPAGATGSPGADQLPERRQRPPRLRRGPGPAASPTRKATGQSRAGWPATRPAPGRRAIGRPGVARVPLLPLTGPA